ncbi:acyltransferase [Rhizobium grahamii]|uniref:Acyltransferase n=1 Tax=Rhizobium grahamii TaxID=1120045 RepID=A0A5Q0CBS1_9HYPH|nr:MULTISPECIES: acyltransferase [Rhizobium]QFY61347.1 acyltransferase [Rhizobium grahamii]QRM49504.1 acyltransferase [Rhizobium sp. BG6]
MASQSGSEQKYYPLFDYLRIFLAVVVMLWHDGVLDWNQSGNFAVQVFFALSGWLIGGLLIDMSSRELPRFYFNRAMRIWIPYFITLALLVSVSLLKDHLTFKWLEIVFYKASFVYNLFGTQQLAEFVNAMPLQGTGNHFWSVDAEEQFYLVAPFLLVMIRPFGRSPLLWAVLAATAWWCDLYASIVFGVFAAVSARRFGHIHSFTPARVMSFGGVLIFSSALFEGLSYEAWAPLLAICIVMLLAVPGKPLFMGRFLGGMSYPLYLNHWIGVFAANAVLGPFGLKASILRHVLSAVLNLGIAAALYQWVDRRILAVRGDIFTPERGRLAMCLGYGLVSVGVVTGLVLTNIVAPHA